MRTATMSRTFRRLAEVALSRGIKIAPQVIENKGHTEILTFEAWVRLHHPRFQWYTHNLKVAEVLQRVADGELRRLMIFWPPRHGKTEMLSRLFTAYYLYRHPERWVGLTSYGADLAHELSGQAMENFTRGGGMVHPRSGSRKLWRTMFGGGMWAAGVGGPITGRGFHLGLIDEPIKNAEAADSKLIREKQKEWFRSTFSTRAEPDEAIVLIMTRWNQDDLAGWQLTQEWEEAKAGKEGHPTQWYIVNLQAIRDYDEQVAFPPTCQVMEDYRAHGEALCPERYSVAKLRQLMRTIGAYFWGALFQQNPTPKGGSIFKRSSFAQLHISLIPPMRQIVAGADLAYTKKTSADFTCVFPLGVDHIGRYYLFRPYRVQQEATVVLPGIASRCVEAGAMILGVESVAAQAAYLSHLRVMPSMAGRAIIGVPADMDKEARANGWAPIVEAGLVTLVTDGTGWEETFMKEAEEFPRGAHDDQIDAGGIAFTVMTEAVAGTPVAGTAASLRAGLDMMKTIPKGMGSV